MPGRITNKWRFRWRQVGSHVPEGEIVVYGSNLSEALARAEEQFPAQVPWIIEAEEIQ